MGTELFIAIGVFPVELLACQVSMVCATKLAKIALFKEAEHSFCACFC